MYISKIWLFFLLLFVSTISKSQSTDYSIKFEGIADNREFFSNLDMPETIFGSRLAFSLGTTVDSIHHVRAGLSYFYEFGSTLNHNLPSLLLYYQVEKNNLSFIMGAFPRKENLCLPFAFVAEKYEYYHPVIEGLLLKYQTDQTKLQVFADWLSKQDLLSREQFMAGFIGQQRISNFFAEAYTYLFHKAYQLVRPENQYIEDNMGVAFLIGYDFSEILPLSVLNMKTGLLSSAYRNRGNGLDFDIKNSWYSELNAEYKGFGLSALIKIGNRHQFLMGDSFYNNTKNYARTNFYFTPINFERVKGRFIYSLHFSDIRVDHQQQFSLVYFFN
ncbi:MAG TPA: hypothetical protein PLS94_00920 [Prolixibacteraceae bacterium]|nr:hypothetical protein [Prolixibacteraceae bacterium]